ncbi:MAG: iron export ABC transporter permease subunit FetB [Burkholderiaceae bacterium]
MASDPAIVLSAAELMVAVPLVLVAMALSWWQQLGLGKSLAIGAVRATIQLLLIGQALIWLFSADRWYWVMAVLLLMVVAATQSATSRIAAGGSRWPLRWLCGAAILLGSGVTLVYVNGLVVRVTPWYDPQYLIPIFGMIVGNAMNGAALAADRVRSGFEAHNDEIETLLALGASPVQASARVVREAISAAMIPTVNALTVVGLVSLPGMMTGQILAGADPTQAVHYQLVVMFMLTGATAITAVCTAIWYRNCFFTPAAQLRELY